MTRVYAIHTGSYSDQSWGPVFSMVEKALAYKAAYKGDDCEIEVHLLDDENDTGPAYPSWRILFNRQGDVVWHEGGREEESFEPLLHHPNAMLVFEKEHWSFFNAHPDGHILVQAVFAPDLEHAIKIAADARRQLLASIQA